MGKQVVDSPTKEENQISLEELPKGSRILTPDSMYTMDFKPDRLNLHIDETGHVIKETHG